ncbi:hypothetical protein [Chromobacterium sp. IIBBL 290-4]|uniref:hypothetical protein n=1 Tax=Chromobacterium sp. IIBBL 290-4 TaxID=2953890 RepID=UPI0020B6A3AF|nr:hypothetical protein [Chromobacterium sp. IIBBL 290-4]UTH75012.1 hypothetical protein NKT35_02580 [Chromobacterium sp. IIBBL 290-4]
MTMQFCEVCGKATEHKELIKQKPSKYGASRREQLKAFVDGFFSGVGGGGAAAIDLIDRYVVCQECGHKKLENHGEQFQ